MFRTTAARALLFGATVALLGCQDTTAPGDANEEYTLVGWFNAPLPMEVWIDGVTRTWIVGGALRFRGSEVEWSTISRYPDGSDSTRRATYRFVRSGPYRIVEGTDTLVIRGDTLRRLGEAGGFVFRRTAP